VPPLLPSTKPSAEDINLSLSYTLMQKYLFVVLYSEEGASGLDDPRLMQTLGAHLLAVI